MDESKFVIHSSAPQTLGFRALRRCLNFGAFARALVAPSLSHADLVAFRRVFCDKILEYVIHSCLSGLSAFEVLDSGFSPALFFFFLGACFVSAGFGLGVVEKNAILLFFLPSLIVESWKSTALLSNSFPAVDKASGEEKKKRRSRRRRREICFGSADFCFGVVEINEILLLFLPCLICRDL